MQAAVLVDAGFQDAEVLVPYYRLLEAGVDALLVGREAGAEVRGKYGYTVTTDAAADQVAPGLVVVPGGYAPGVMRLHAPFVDLVRRAIAGDATVAAVCHGPQLLIEAGVVSGRRMTSWYGVRTDLVNAGADWVDEPVVVDGDLITSRTPDDLPAFCRALVDAVAGAGA